MELNTDLRRTQVSGQCPRKMDEKIMARCLSTVGEPHSEILHAPHLFFNIKLNLKVLITRLLLVLEVWDGKPIYRKSWAGNLLVWSDLTLDLSFKVK